MQDIHAALMRFSRQLIRLRQVEQTFIQLPPTSSNSAYVKDYVDALEAGIDRLESTSLRRVANDRLTKPARLTTYGPLAIALGFQQLTPYHFKKTYPSGILNYYPSTNRWYWSGENSGTFHGNFADLHAFLRLRLLEP